MLSLRDLCPDVPKTIVGLRRKGIDNKRCMQALFSRSKPDAFGWLTATAWRVLVAADVGSASPNSLPASCVGCPFKQHKHVSGSHGQNKSEIATNPPSGSITSGQGSPSLPAEAMSLD
jgi:hypothetical protein